MGQLYEDEKIVNKRVHTENSKEFYFKEALKEILREKRKLFLRNVLGRFESMTQEVKNNVMDNCLFIMGKLLLSKIASYLILFPAHKAILCKF